MSEEELKSAKAMYERFKLTWMLDNNFTLADLVHELVNLSVESDPGLSLDSVFTDWEFERGFGSQIWPCFEEFLECEYKEMRAGDMFPQGAKKVEDNKTMGCEKSVVSQLKQQPQPGRTKTAPKKGAEMEI